VLVSVVSDQPKQPAVYKKRLAGLKGLSHVTVEVETCPLKRSAGILRTDQG
jgi:hypothetical protein